MTTRFFLSKRNARGEVLYLDKSSKGGAVWALVALPLLREDVQDAQGSRTVRRWV